MNRGKVWTTRKMVEVKQEDLVRFYHPKKMVTPVGDTQLIKSGNGNQWNIPKRWMIFPLKKTPVCQWSPWMFPAYHAWFEGKLQIFAAASGGCKVTAGFAESDGRRRWDDWQLLGEWDDFMVFLRGDLGYLNVSECDFYWHVLDLSGVVLDFCWDYNGI